MFDRGSLILSRVEKQEMYGDMFVKHGRSSINPMTNKAYMVTSDGQGRSVSLQTIVHENDGSLLLELLFNSTIEFVVRF